MQLIQKRSPNYGPRKGRAPVDLIVLHYTAMESCAAALERLCAAEYEVSAHYLIAEGGEVYHLVDEEMRAWHAGAGQWGDVTDVNSRSIGIELANDGAQPFSDPQMAALQALLGDVMARHAIPPQRVIGHSDMAPGRKIDPGARFDWRRLALLGLSVWPEQVTPDDPAGFCAWMKLFGYPRNLDNYQLLKAFRLRFRPGVEGPITGVDAGMIHDLARRFPVDLAQATS